MIQLVFVLIAAVIAAVIGVVKHVKIDKRKKTNAPPDRMPTQAERMIDEAQFVFEPVETRRQPRPAAPPRIPAKSAPRKPAASSGHHAEHCAVAHDGGGKYRVERVPGGGSIGGKSSEGCGEHYGVRFVKVDQKQADDDKIYVSKEDMRRAIVLGQVLNDPAFKRRYGGVKR